MVNLVYIFVKYIQSISKITLSFLAQPRIKVFPPAAELILLINNSEFVSNLVTMDL